MLLDRAVGFSRQHTIAANSPANHFKVDGGAGNLQALHAAITLRDTLAAKLVNGLLGSIDGILSGRQDVVVGSGSLTRGTALALGQIFGQVLLCSIDRSPGKGDLGVFDTHFSRSPGNSIRSLVGVSQTCLCVRLSRQSTGVDLVNLLHKYFIGIGESLVRNSRDRDGAGRLQLVRGVSDRRIYSIGKKVLVNVALPGRSQCSVDDS